MAIRSVDEIINLSDSSKNPEKLAFKDLVQHIDPRIRGRAPRHNSLNFKIPGILWGQPVFNADRVEKMIVHHYNSIGFKCVRLAKREILIQWGEGGGGEEEEEKDDKHDSADDCTESSDTDSADSTESSETGTSEATESTDSSDGDDSRENKTKCVTVEQIPLSKRLSIVNNQLQQNL
ncbi:unnamed protein product [Ectocarpus sp. 12 AP-2014]